MVHSFRRVRCVMLATVLVSSAVRAAALAETNFYRKRNRSRNADSGVARIILAHYKLLALL